MRSSLRVSKTLLSRPQVQIRSMATEKQLRERMVGTQNIEKITKSMKMVSAAKLRGDQNRLAAAIPFARWAGDITGEPQELETISTADFPQKNLIIPLTTDKGLCGGVNSILSRQTMAMMRSLESEGKDYDMYIVGEKGRAIMNRQFSSKIVASATDRAAPYNFEMISSITELALSGEYDAIHIVYNKFKSAIAYIPSIKSITPLLDPASEALYSYEVEPENDPDTLRNFYEYTLATQLYHSTMDNATSEQSSRMNAMENASKNAAEQIAKLTLQYNRARQARITTELIEIISGAAALEK